MSEADPDAALIAKANAGVPHWHGAEIHYSGTPELMQVYAGLAVDCGARIVGGCCGNTPAHVAAIRRGLDGHRPGNAADRRGNRRGARAAGRAPGGRAGGAKPPSRAVMNAKAKRRAWGGVDEADREAPTRPRRPRPPLVAPSGPQAFDVDAAAAGERLDRFLGRSASERRLALSRTRIKALIEAGEVTVDGATARDPALEARRGRARSGSRRRLPRRHRSRARTYRSRSCSRTST